MPHLESFLNEIDNSLFDYGEASKIKEQLQKIAESLKDKDQNDSEKLNTKLEYEIQNINASVERGLEPQCLKEGKNEAGEEVRWMWPDLRGYSEKEFSYLKNRYVQTKNLYLKSKYGLVLFLLKHKADNQFVLELTNNLWGLSKNYLKKKEPHNHNMLYFSNSLKNALYLSQKRKSVVEIGDKYKQILKFIYDTHLELAKDKKEGEFIINVLTNLMIQNFNDFTKNFKLEEVLEANWNISVETFKTNKQRTIDISKINLKFSTILKADVTRWHKLIAECYESLAKEREGMVAPEFYTSAIRHYKIINATEKAKQLHLLLSEAKTKMNFGKIEYALPPKETQIIMDEMRKEIESKDSDFIINRLALGVYFLSFSKVKEDSKKDGFSLAQIISTSFYDKHGNKNSTVSPKNSDEDASFYSTYDMHFQIPSQIYLKYFLDSLKAGKINFEIIHSWLETKTWYGDKILRVYNGYTNEISILELLSPVLKLFFDDFTSALTKENFSPNYVCILDSITLKVEYIIRILCDEKLNIPTSYINSDGTVDEKTFTALIYDLKTFIKEHPSISDEMKLVLLDDVIFIDFVMNSKAGKNIRNKVAHAHLDLEEYSPLKIVLVFAIILKLSLLKTGSSST